jgi:hypothetical protein
MRVILSEQVEEKVKLQQEGNVPRQYERTFLKKPSVGHCEVVPGGYLQDKIKVFVPIISPDKRGLLFFRDGTGWHFHGVLFMAMDRVLSVTARRAAAHAGLAEAFLHPFDWMVGEYPECGERHFCIAVQARREKIRLPEGADRFEWVKTWWHLDALLPEAGNPIRRRFVLDTVGFLRWHRNLHWADKNAISEVN